MKSGGHQKSEAKTQGVYSQHKKFYGVAARWCWNKISSFWNRLWLVGNRPEARFAGWVARLTLVLCVIGAIQAWSFIQSERAYLSASRFSFVGGLAAGKPLNLSFFIHNSGKSPAQINNISVTTKQILTRPLSYDKLIEISPFDIVAGASEAQIYNGKTADGQPFIISEGLASAVKSGTAKFYVYGFIDYDDDYSIFGPRRTLFCYVYRPDLVVPGADVFGGCPVEQQH